MNLINPFGPLGRTARRRRIACLAVEAMESRLVLSPTLPLPPPHATSFVANLPNGPCLPSGPCASQVSTIYPSGPCTSQALSNFPNGPCSISH
jgi:hypothetical protein